MQKNLTHKKFSLSGKISLSLIVFLALFALFAPLFLPYVPNEIELDSKFAPPSFTHFLGTDYLGRDIFTRLVYGARISLGASLAIVCLILFFGISIGSISGFIGGRVDKIIMRICDLFFSLPTIVLSLFFVGILGSGLSNVIIAIALTHWAWYARIVRSIVFGLKNKEFVLLSKAYGASAFQSFKRNMLAPILTQCLVLASMDIGHIILHIAGLSFLGLGVQPPLAEWGVMLSDCKDYIWSNPELVLYPGVALFVSIALFNILGDSLRDYLDSDLEDLK
ncbi:nickel ABC transporter permease subunit NikC [Helicobacter himalayensis]|uniref:nickel ABC transporter permease subunit NikC n=1 Tax=Helicobacter himalayensis TaxID=1591088 RepID=UPI0008331DAB|nr:nickel ABC transporter permease subunit NikC [Helicobacter himalayensis]